jgi:carbon storage regulator CsrA
MLILTRRAGETVVLETENEKITLHFDLDGRQIKVGISAPQSVHVVRGELLERVSKWVMGWID